LKTELNPLIQSILNADGEAAILESVTSDTAQRLFRIGDPEGRICVHVKPTIFVNGLQGIVL
jgi:hypothetical protein